MGLGLVLGHQYLEQLPQRLRAAILGNVGSIIAFQLSGADAGTIGTEIRSQVSRDARAIGTARGVGETRDLRWAAYAAVASAHKDKRDRPRGGAQAEWATQYISAAARGGEDCEVLE